MRIAILVVSVLVLGFFGLPSLIVGLEGGFCTQEVSRFASPDGALVLSISKRTAFPANEWIDPRTIVIVKLIRVETTQDERSRITLLEDSDLREPRITWRQPNSVRVSGLDSRNPGTIDLTLR